MFEHILVPLDGSSLAETALPHVMAVARAFGSRITLLRVLDPLGEVTRPRSVDPFDWQIRKAEADVYLKKIAADIQDSGLAVETEVMEGKAAEAIVDYSREKNASLIVMSSHGQSGISGWNVSSVVQKIILRSRTSMMIVRAYLPTPGSMLELSYKSIILPLDGSQRAEIVLPAAVALARYHEASLHAVHVVKQPEMARRTPPTQEDVDLANQVVERNRVEAARYLEEIPARMDMRVETDLIVSENVPASLHSYVEQVGADLLILSAHGYSGETRWPYGSTVISFIAYGATPLIIIQDVPPERIEPSTAEMAVREQGGR